MTEKYTLKKLGAIATDSHNTLLRWGVTGITIGLAECTPIVILRGYKDIPFSDTASMDNFKIKPELDLYRPLIEILPKVYLCCDKR